MRAAKANGFTLIELMIVVVILGIIVAIAYPAYTNQVQKTRRADATTALLGAAQQLERCFTRFNSYLQADGCPNLTGPTERGFYTIGFAEGDGVVGRSQTTFTLTATPQGSQAGDTACGVFTLDHRGNRTPAPSVDRCWGSS